MQTRLSHPLLLAFWPLGPLHTQGAKATKVSKDDFVFLKMPTKKEDLPPGSVPFLYLAAYELDSNHWPTGERTQPVWCRLLLSRQASGVCC